MNVRERHETQCHVESEVFIVSLVVMVIWLYFTVLGTLKIYEQII